MSKKQSRLEAAIALWNGEEISLRRAAEMAGICLEEIMEELVKRGLPLYHYSAAEAFQDAQRFCGESDFIDYWTLANLYDNVVCFGCGRPDPGSHATPPWPAIRDHLEKHAHWKSEDLAAEAIRYQALVDAGVPVVLCDDCWHLGYDWTPGEAERLHARARRFAHETEHHYWRRCARLYSWQDKTRRNPRFRAVSLAALRWAHIWLLNNPGSELPYKAAP